jgi:hypothetical protein
MCDIVQARPAQPAFPWRSVMLPVETVDTRKEAFYIFLAQPK